MKKKATLLVAAALLAIVAASCTHNTCPAYRGSTVMNAPAQIELAMAE